MEPGCHVHYMCRGDIKAQSHSLLSVAQEPCTRQRGHQSSCCTSRLPRSHNLRRGEGTSKAVLVQVGACMRLLHVTKPLLLLCHGRGTEGSTFALR